jgi:hypothetical protein
MYQTQVTYTTFGVSFKHVLIGIISLMGIIDSMRFPYWNANFLEVYKKLMCPIEFHFFCCIWQMENAICSWSVNIRIQARVFKKLTFWWDSAWSQFTKVPVEVMLLSQQFDKQTLTPIRQVLTVTHCLCSGQRNCVAVGPTFALVIAMFYVETFEQCALDLVGVQEVIWDRGGTEPAGKYTSFYGKASKTRRCFMSAAFQLCFRICH